MKTKHVISFFNDTVIVLGLLFVVVSAFLATYALSPVAFEDSILARDGSNKTRTNQSGVLGLQSDNDEVKYEDIYKSHDYFNVESASVNGEYVATISIGPVSKGEIAKPIVHVENPSQKTKTLQVKIGVSEYDAKDINLFLTIDGEKQKVQEGTNGQISVTLPSKISKNIGIIIENAQNTHYTSTYSLSIVSQN